MSNLVGRPFFSFELVKKNCGICEINDIEKREEDWFYKNHDGTICINMYFPPNEQYVDYLDCTIGYGRSKENQTDEENKDMYLPIFLSFLDNEFYFAMEEIMDPKILKYYDIKQITQNYILFLGIFSEFFGYYLINNNCNYYIDFNANDEDSNMIIKFGQGRAQMYYSNRSKTKENCLDGYYSIYISTNQDPYLYYNRIFFGEESFNNMFKIIDHDLKDLFT